MSLTAVSRAVQDVHAAGDDEARRAEARRVAALIDDLDPRTGEGTRRKLWLQLGRMVAGGGWLMGAAVNADRARVECLAMLDAGPPRRGRGQPLKYGEPMLRTPLRLPASLRAELERTAGLAGHSLNDEIIARCSR